LPVQLVREKDGSHLWSERWDRDLESIFDIQDEISLAVVDALKVKLLETEKAAIVKRHTKDLAAYDFYLRGNEYYWRGYEQQNFSLAIRMYQKAIELDPEFALAYSQLAMSHLFLYHFRFDWSEDRLRQSKQSIDAAFKLEPELNEAYIASGFYHYVVLDYDKAFEQYEIALKITPKMQNAISGSLVPIDVQATGKRRSKVL